MKQKPKFEYYNVDAGHFPAQIKLCFSDHVFQQILKDHNIKTKEKALELGLAETHYFTEGKEAIIVVVFDLGECVTADASLLISTIAHESYHITRRVFDYIGEEDAGEESTAYLLDHIAKQLYTGFIVERTKRAGKTSGKIPNQKGKGVGRADVQMDQLSQWRAGPACVPKREVPPGGVKNGDRGSVT